MSKDSEIVISSSGIELTGAKKMHCANCDKDASPLVIVLNLKSVEPEVIKPELWCRACWCLWENTGDHQEHQVGKS